MQLVKRFVANAWSFGGENIERRKKLQAFFLSSIAADAQLDSCSGDECAACAMHCASSDDVRAGGGPPNEAAGPPRRSLENQWEGVVEIAFGRGSMVVTSVREPESPGILRRACNTARSHPTSSATKAAS